MSDPLFRGPCHEYCDWPDCPDYSTQFTCVKCRREVPCAEVFYFRNYVLDFGPVKQGLVCHDCVAAMTRDEALEYFGVRRVRRVRRQEPT